jgi:predicted nucleotidyltransferase
MIAELVDELRRVHGAHAAIVYGSFARGDATNESDVDIAAFADVAEVTRDARLWNGIYLDAFVYPSETEPSVELLKLVGGQIVLDDRGVARRLLERIDELERRGPTPLSEPEARMRRVWAQKTLARVQRGDAEGNYRRHQLLVNLLEDYFALRGTWFRGAKVALGELPPRARETFERALAPDAPHEALARLVELVIA